MKTSCERPYRYMIATAAALRQLPEDATPWQVRRLATELAHAVTDLDTRLRAGLDAPRAWQVLVPRTGTHPAHDPSDARAADDSRSGDRATRASAPDAPVTQRHN